MTGARPVRVLLADDHPPTRDDIRRALVADGGFVICAEAAHAAEAVAAAVRERPDVCLLDIRMPGNGLDAIWEINARLPTVRIIMLTVSEEHADLLAALSAGAHGYLLKTMNFERLPHAVRGALAGEAPIPRTLVTTMVAQLHDREPRRRRLLDIPPARERLTTREWQVLELLAEDLDTHQMAHRLSLSASAVRSHVASLIRKLGVADRAAAVALFRRPPET
jgi:two-component system, NarL family, nitrate/nitrite response regulator NarL